MDANVANLALAFVGFISPYLFMWLTGWGKNAEKLSNLATSFERLSERVEGVDLKLNSILTGHGERITRVEEKAHSLSTKTMVAYDRAESVEQQVRHLEGRVSRAEHKAGL